VLLELNPGSAPMPTIYFDEKFMEARGICPLNIVKCSNSNPNIECM
jgi:hypothetical protein